MKFNHSILRSNSQPKAQCYDFSTQKLCEDTPIIRPICLGNYCRNGIRIRAWMACLRIWGDTSTSWNFIEIRITGKDQKQSTTTTPHWNWALFPIEVYQTRALTWWICFLKPHFLSALRPGPSSTPAADILKPPKGVHTLLRSTCGICTFAAR